MQSIIFATVMKKPFRHGRSLLLIGWPCAASTCFKTNADMLLNPLTLRGGNQRVTAIPSLAWDALSSALPSACSQEILPLSLPFISHILHIIVQTIFLSQTLNILGVFADKSSQQAHLSLNNFLKSPASLLDKVARLSCAFLDRLEKERSMGGQLHWPTIQKRWRRGVDLNYFVQEFPYLPHKVHFGIGFGVGRLLGTSFPLVAVGVGGFVLFQGGRGGGRWKPSNSEEWEWKGHDEECKDTWDPCNRIRIEWVGLKYRIGSWKDRMSSVQHSIWEDSEEVTWKIVQEGVLWGILSGLLFKN